MRKKVKVLLIEENQLIQNSLARGISGNGQFSISGIATDANSARILIAEETPDVLVINVKLQKLNGVEFFQDLFVKSPIPTIVICHHTGLSRMQARKALRSGAIDYVQIPQIKSYKQIEGIINDLKEKIIMASMVNLDYLKTSQNSYTQRKKAIIIGASNGGVEATRTLLDNLPSGMPPILIAQHQPEFATNSYANLLNKLYPSYVKVAKDEDLLLPNQIMFAPAGKQTRIIKNISNGLQVDVCYQKMNHNPSIRILMESAASATGSESVGIILSGIGDDGAIGLKTMRDAGANTIAQGEASSAVHGMPKRAIETGGVEKVLPVNEIGDYLLELISP